MPHFPKGSRMDVFVSYHRFDYPQEYVTVGCRHGSELLVLLSGWLHKYWLHAVRINSAQERRFKQYSRSMMIYVVHPRKKDTNLFNMSDISTDIPCGLFERWEDINYRQHPRAFWWKYEHFNIWNKEWYRYSCIWIKEQQKRTTTKVIPDVLRYVTRCPLIVQLHVQPELVCRVRRWRLSSLR